MLRHLTGATVVAVPLLLALPGAVAAQPTGPVLARSSHKACTSANLLRALPSSATMKKFVCATDDGGTKWAAVLLKQGPTLYFEKYQPKKDRWTVYLDTDICGTASAGLPPKILAYCKYSS